MDNCWIYIDMFEIITSLVTVIGAFVAVYTLYEIKKQRESTYKPHIVIENEELTIDTEKFPFTYHTKNDGFNSGNIDYSLKFLNIGLGSAKKIKVEFQFDFIHYFNLIHKNNSEIESYHFQFGITDSNVGFIVRNIGNAFEPKVLSKNLKFDFNYILPVSIQNDKFEIPVPESIIYINSILILQHLNNEKLKSKPFNLNFDLELKYLDVGNKERTVKYKIRFTKILLLESYSNVHLEVINT